MTKRTQDTPEQEIIYIDRPPRIQPELPFDEVEIPKPPSRETGGLQRLIQMALPMLTIIGYVGVMALARVGRSPWIMIPMALSVLASTGFAIYSYFQDKKRQEQLERDYLERLIELNKEMEEAHDMQRRFYHYNYPDKDTLFRIVENARREALKKHPQLRAETRLWERRVSDEDFGVVRLGIGVLPSTVRYVLGNVENFDDPLLRDAMKLEEDSLYVDNIPVIISLRQQQAHDEIAEEQEGDPNAGRTPVVHALGIAGEPTSVYPFIQVLLAHFVTFHSPSDARLFVLASKKRMWDWTDALPHAQDDEQLRYRLFLDEVSTPSSRDNGNKQPTDDEGELEIFLENFRKLLSQRRIRLSEREDGTREDPRHPFLLMVVDLMEAAYDKNSPLYDLESDAGISILLEQGAALGAAVIFLLPERSKIPSGCQGIIEVERTSPASNRRTPQLQKLHFRYAETGVNTFRYIGEADAIPNPSLLKDLAEKLATMRIRETHGAGLPSVVPFLDLMGYPNLEALIARVPDMWAESEKPENADWLQVRIGRMPGNKPRTLMFSVKRDGVHGMVAGSTGSGKSELLITLVTGLAVTYAPSVVNFVLVDYKGGGAFKGLENLPHTVDVITNLNEEAVVRMFTAIKSEMERRQDLLARSGVKTIVEYRRQGLHLDQPLPFLFIIIDEFAEMIAQRSEFKSELESITRLGRALGVSLILAAQRPTGVTDQMRANIKFRICLRVETPAESREMLRRTEAAYLPGNIPGRGYLQVGNDELELIQVAYTGEKYIPLGAREQVPKVIWPERGGGYNESLEQEPPELYRAIVDMLDAIAQAEHFPEQQAPWPDFLPTQFTLVDPLFVPPREGTKPITHQRYLADVNTITLGAPFDESLTLNPALSKWLNDEVGWIEAMDWHQHAWRPVVGLVDNPYDAQQTPLIIDLTEGHVALFGASGWGKTTFIRTMVTSLAATHSPELVHMYILDLGGRNLGVLGHFPHVGAVIIPDEEGYNERVEQLLRELEALVDQRKTLFSTWDAPDLPTYNAMRPDDPLPATVVFIDNFVEFKETFGETRDNVESVLEKFILLARQSKPYGVHFVITANHLNELSNQLFNIFTERLALRLSDPSEYRAIVGASVNDAPSIPGRGYIRSGLRALSCQIALPIATTATTSESEELRQVAESMQVAATRLASPHRHPIRVDALPKTVLFKQILARQYQLPLDGQFAHRLREQTIALWQRSLQPEEADWLQATFALTTGNRLRTLHLEAKKDGVHGLIAGGTGAGKSELLMTLIVSLALRYDPSILNFVLVDYKGGGAFLPFQDLPHCVDTITNLNKTAVKRMFTAITAELERRQKLNAETGTKDIVEYRSKGLHLTREPYPHLFIIIDEYAEMITDNPEFKEELDRITRLGRALGVSLILASQRPTGVTDQMRANIKFRICLRVESESTSRELLRRSDAAYLPNGMPGRGYLQVGNENIELIQVAYTGETVDFLPTPEEGREPKFYDFVVQLAKEIWGKPKPRTPWPPFLPRQLTLTETLYEDYLDPSSLPPHLRTSNPQSPVLNPHLLHWLRDEPGWPALHWQEDAMRVVVGLVDDPYHARQLPLLLNFQQDHVAVIGAAGWGKSTFLRSLILSLAATHGSDKLHVHILDLGGRSLQALQSLPQVGTVIMPDERGYEERVQQLLRELEEMVESRKRSFSEAGVSSLYEFNLLEDQHPLPAVLVVIDNFAEFMETFGGGKTESEQNILENFTLLVRQAKPFGVHFLIAADRYNALPPKLFNLFTRRISLRQANPDDYRTILGGQVVEVEEIPGRGYIKIGRFPLLFQTATLTSQGGAVQSRQEVELIRKLGQQMSQWVANALPNAPKPLQIAALPKTSSYRQVLADLYGLPLGKHFIPELKRVTQRLWEENRQPENADWLKVVLGVTSGHRYRELQFEAKKDGVHGLIAGGTGSGKSELLMTMIVGLAIRYSPDVLNFVLVDYKGGGAFKPFEALPHCVDIVTNLDKAAVNRMFTSINAEIRRRQALNASTGTKDIVEYRRRGLHLTHQPYPHLFVIIDEYAEMISDNPEFRAELESITRVGRAQGINLILASQRPKGVTDQMRANIKFRICLRVEEQDTSREMLRRPDAAFLPNGLPGRGFLQVGNAPLELIQVSWTGETQPMEQEPPVLWPQRPLPPPSEEEPPKFYDAVVRLTSELTDGKMAPKPWPGFLPTHFSLQSPLYDAQHDRTVTLVDNVTDWLNGEGTWQPLDWTSAVRPLVGLLDNPAEAQQTPLYFDFKTSHLAIFGDSGWGKTTLLRSLMTSLAATHSPNDLHFYVLDLGGRNFTNFEHLPHTGAVIYATDETFDERLQRLLAKLNKLVDERQHILSEANAESIYDYNQAHPDHVLPAVLVFIDNFAELQENYENLVQNELIPLARRSLRSGVVFVLAANVPTHIPSRLLSLIGQRITFKQNNPDRYMDIVGRGAIDIDDIPGRGYIRIGRRPLLFHAALPVGLPRGDDHRDDRSEGEELQLLSQNMQQVIQSRTFFWENKPDPISTLPNFVSLDAVLRKAGEPHPRRIQALLGINADLKTARFDLKRMGPHFAVVGPPLSGKTTVLYDWILSIAYRYPPERAAFIIIDLQNRFADYGGQRRFDQLPHVLTTIREMEELSGLVENLKREGEIMAGEDSQREIFVVIDNYDDFASEIERKHDLREGLATIARRHGRDGIHFIIAGTLDGASDDLRRRVMASNFGIGLQNDQAIQTLKVKRIPPNLRHQELPVGRGYIVRSGMATLIQLASPYEGMGLNLEGALDDEETRIALALDKWIARIREKYAETQAQWSTEDTLSEEEVTPTGPKAEVSKKALEMITLLHEGLRHEIARIKTHQTTHKTILEKLLQALKGWYDEQELLELLRQAYANILRAEGKPESEIQTQLETFQVRGLIRELEQRVRTGKATGGLNIRPILANIRKHDDNDELIERWKLTYINWLKHEGLSEEEIQAKLVRTWKLPNGQEKVTPLQMRDLIPWLEETTREGKPIPDISLESLFMMDKRSWYEGQQLADVLRESYEKLLRADGLSEQDIQRKLEQAGDDFVAAIVAHLPTAEDGGELTLEKLFAYHVHQWYDERVLTELLREIYKRIADPVVAEQLQADDLILELKEKLPKTSNE